MTMALSNSAKKVVMMPKDQGLGVSPTVEGRRALQDLVRGLFQCKVHIIPFLKPVRFAF